jgi:hypothetical protein
MHEYTACLLQSLISGCFIHFAGDTSTKACSVLVLVTPIGSVRISPGSSQPGFNGSLANNHFHPLGCRHDIVLVLQKES